MFFLWSDSYLRDGDADQREILHDRTYRFRTLLLPFWGRYSRGVPKIQNFNSLKTRIIFISKTVSRSVTCQLELKTSSTRALWKCTAWDGSAAGETPEKICIFWPGRLISGADQREHLHDGRVLSIRGFGGDIVRGLQIEGQNVYF